MWHWIESYESALEFCKKNGLQYDYWGRNFHYDHKDTRDDMKCIVELYGPEESFNYNETVS